MGLLQYTSNEMYSSTDLVRKSKYIFDKLNKNEIEKAIILRDGKPGIILMDFSYYEKIMSEYLLLKENKKTNSANNSKSKEVIPENNNYQNIDDKEKIGSKELQSTLDQIDNSDFNFDSSKANEDKIEPLKEFWD